MRSLQEEHRAELEVVQRQLTETENQLFRRQQEQIQQQQQSNQPQGTRSPPSRLQLNSHDHHQLMRTEERQSGEVGIDLGIMFIITTIAIIIIKIIVTSFHRPYFMLHQCYTCGEGSRILEQAYQITQTL